MPLSIGLITVRGPDYHPNRRLAQAAASRGLEVVLLDPYRLACGLEGGLVVQGLPGGRLPRVILPRQGATLAEFCLLLLEQMELAGARLVNSPRAVRLCSDQFRCLQILAAAGLPVPPSRQVATPEAFDQAVEELGGVPLVAKRPAGRQGRGVSLLDGPEKLALARHFLLKRRRGLLLQGFIPPQGRRDLRLLMLGRELAAAVELEPPRGEFRANFHLGGRLAPFTPPAAVLDLARRAMQALGLEIAGLDLVLDQQGRPWFLEANYAPGFKGLEAATGLDIAGRMLDHVASIASSLERGR